jgi:phospholipid N-methyltransferase
MALCQPILMRFASVRRNLGISPIPPFVGNLAGVVPIPLGLIRLLHYLGGKMNQAVNHATHVAALYLANSQESVSIINSLIDDSGRLNPALLAKTFQVRAVDPESEIPGAFGKTLKLDVDRADLKQLDWNEIAEQFTSDLAYALKSKEVVNVVREILANDIIIDGNLVRLSKQLEHQDYLKVNTALNALGGKWNRQRGGHVFDEDPTDAIESVILTGKWEKKKDFDFYPTPKWLAETMVNLALIEPGMRVLEPEAGDAAIASVILELCPGVKLDVLELDNGRREKLHTQGYNCVGSDFLAYQPGRIYDRVVANPPFSHQQDVDHVLHMASMLKPGGRLVAVMSASITFRTNRKTVQFNEWLRDHNGQIHNNPDRTFAASGTTVKTVTVTADI